MTPSEPKCLFAIFADKCELADDGQITLFKVHSQVMFPELPAGVRIANYKRSLWVALVASLGTHRLTISHRGSEWVKTADIQVEPEHGNTFVQEIEAEFPMFVNKLTLNEYPILLDAEALTTAYLFSAPSK